MANGRSRLLVPIATSALVAGALFSFDRSAVTRVWDVVSHDAWWTLPLTLCFAAGARAIRATTTGGACAGGLIAWLLIVAFGPRVWIPLGAGLIATVAATRAGYARKAAAGIAQTRGGQRGPRNIVANVGVSGAAAIVALGTGHVESAAVAAIAALATSVSDTVATEVGQTARQMPRLVTSWRRVPTGTPGAVSARGVGAAVVCAAALSGIAAAAGVVSVMSAAIITASAVVASLAEGVVTIGAESRGWIDNDGVNLVSSVAGALIAWLVYALFERVG